MYNLYESIYALCCERNITPGGLCSELGFRRSILSDLKSGRKKTLDTTTLVKIANYFGVSVDYLLTGEEKEKPLVNGDEELTEYLDELRNRPEMRMLFSTTKNATKAQIEAIVKFIEGMQ